ncbi:hypothetical protein N7414_28610 [Pseudomonas sp. GD04087]|uniref:hypothetical protein n=1 Tax=unclassified Pseudomonas TaxID=196821 RepID=UPI002446DEDE|nr:MULTISPECIES: hypothetical protein [unclassified Pseudomonas]MDH0293100.1 hypothetical protein [Pseudomonas sp. GD04087]MDH1052281.1 hypothetical protein [Pseudomonas sp. GD03903]MDH2003335.1 hypothetical protein [Pseudomonas sp. GD03691]
MLLHHRLGAVPLLPAKQAASFWQFIGGSRVNLHRSALLDYRYYLMRGILNRVLLLPIVGLVDPYLLRRATTSPCSPTSALPSDRNYLLRSALIEQMGHSPALPLRPYPEMAASQGGQ